MSWMAPGRLMSEEDARRRGEGTRAVARPTREDRRQEVYYVGIDLAKFKHSAAVVGDDGKRLVRGFDFPNRRDGFEALLRRLESVGATGAEARVCLEATGHYGRNLVAFLEGHGYEVFEVNPLLTANWRRATSVRKVKNDAVDAEALALWLLAGNPTARRRAKDESDDLRALARSRTSLSHMIGDCKRRAVAILDVTFPELHGFFSDDFGVAATPFSSNPRQTAAPISGQSFTSSPNVSTVRPHLTSRQTFTTGERACLTPTAAASLPMTEAASPTSSGSNVDASPIGCGKMLAIPHCAPCRASPCSIGGM